MISKITGLSNLGNQNDIMETIVLLILAAVVLHNVIVRESGQLTRWLETVINCCFQNAKC